MLIYITHKTGNVFVTGTHTAISQSKFATFNLEYDHRGNVCIRYEKLYLQYDGRLSTKKCTFRIHKNIISGLTIEDNKYFFIRKYSQKSRLGIVHWGGTYRLTDQDFLYEGAKAIKDMGINHFKMYLGRKSDMLYLTNFQNSTPDKIITQPNYQRILNMGFKTIVIVSHGNVSDDNSYYNSKYWKQNPSKKLLSRETDQMYKLATELGKFPKTKFIITNWEGDNIIDEDGTCEVYANMVKWFQARQKGVDLSGVSNVYHGIEINHVADSLRMGYSSVLTEVVPHVQTDYISYSCYDCSNFGEFRQAINYIDHIADRPIIIGEFGTPVNERSHQESMDYVNGIFQIMQEYQIELGCYWQIYENEYDEEGNPRGFGLIDPKGKCNGLWAMFKYM